MHIFKHYLTARRAAFTLVQTTVSGGIPPTATNTHDGFQLTTRRFLMYFLSIDSTGYIGDVAVKAEISSLIGFRYMHCICHRNRASSDCVDYCETDICGDAGTILIRTGHNKAGSQ